MKILKKVSKRNIITIIVIGIIFISLLIDKRDKSKTLIENGKYTIGYVTKIEPMKGGLVYYYKFEIFGIKSTGEMRSGRYKNVGDKCFVIINPNNIDENKMLLYLPIVPDTIENPPRNGWVKLPIKIKDNELLRAVNGG